MAAHRIRLANRDGARRARFAHAVDEIALSLEAACADAQLIVLATPVDVLPGLVARAPRPRLGGRL